VSVCKLLMQSHTTAALALGVLLAVCLSPMVAHAATHQIKWSIGTLNDASFVAVVGDTVTWTNTDYFNHSIDIAGTDVKFNLTANESVDLNIDVNWSAKSYSYHCRWTDGMNATMTILPNKAASLLGSEGKFL
jgi:plastocyanin